MFVGSLGVAVVRQLVRAAVVLLVKVRRPANADPIGFR